ALGQFREFGEKWGTAIALAQLAEFTELRADHAASIAALEEAASIGNELGAWGDMCYVDAMLAVIRARTGDVARGRADLDRAVRTAEEVGNNGDIGRGVAVVSAEVAGRGGALAGVARSSPAVLAMIEGPGAPWWTSLRARVKARLAMVARGGGDPRRCRELLSEALRAVAEWADHAA